MRKKDKKNVKINLTIDADLEKQFREAISKKYGFARGNMQKGPKTEGRPR